MKIEELKIEDTVPIVSAIVETAMEALVTPLSKRICTTINE